MDLYAENILDHYRHPRRKTLLADATVTHAEANASCGDTLTLSLRIDGGRVTDTGWEGEGCALSQAGMSLLSEELIGRTELEIAQMTPATMRELLGIDVGPQRSKCALLALHAAQNALRMSHGEPPQEWRETLEK